MLGAIAGDVIGSVFERHPIKTVNFTFFGRGSCFTDDTVMTVAVAEALLDYAEPTADDYIDAYHRWFARYPNAGYGGTFFQWAMMQDRKPYNSWGNGSAMRVSPVAYAFDTLSKVLEQAAISAAVTHDHPEGVRGAQAVAGAVFLARTGQDKAGIRRFVEKDIGYDLSRSIDSIRPSYKFDVSCQGSVPESITAFIESTDYETAVRLAISLGGDTDTMACMAGSIAEPFYGGVPEAIKDQVELRLDAPILEVVRRFRQRYPGGSSPTMANPNR